jgi:hypothetical protein
MSGFTCGLQLATSLAPVEIVQKLRDNLPFIAGAYTYDPQSLRTTNDGVLIEVSGAVMPEVTEELFGFRPAVKVSFELARGGDDAWEEGKANELRALDWIIHHLDGDLVFLANGEVPALLRRRNSIWLDRKDWFWRESDLRLLTFPYEWKRLKV